MKTKIVLLSVLVLMQVFHSCTVTKNMKIPVKSLEEIQAFYRSKGITEFYIPKNDSSFVKLSELDKTSLPQGIIFNESGQEIVFLDDKVCGPQTTRFLDNYVSDSSIKISTLTIDNYLSNLKPISANSGVSSKKTKSKLRIFLNTASYLEGQKRNKEAYGIYNKYKDIYDVYIVSLDFIKK